MPAKTGEEKKRVAVVCAARPAGTCDAMLRERACHEWIVRIPLISGHFFATGQELNNAKMRARWESRNLETSAWRTR
ncbi:MAG TPA: hypothetical protein VFB68_19090 [Xanthobacteraceae bacterium]|nr:hypothetical protein [Xanthobacteraceae bacterium]